MLKKRPTQVGNERVCGVNAKQNFELSHLRGGMRGGIPPFSFKTPGLATTRADLAHISRGRGFSTTYKPMGLPTT